MIQSWIFMMAIAGTTAFLYCDSAPQILAIGSSTVFPIAQLYGRKYSDMDVLPVVTSSGSTLGLRNLLTGAVDIGHASRPMAPKDYDNADCDGTLVSADGTVTGPCQGVLPVPIKVGNDVIAVITSPDLELPAQTAQQVCAIFNSTQYSFVIPDKLSGTYDFFIEVCGDDVDANLKGIEGFADDNALIDTMSLATNAIGWVGVGALPNTPKVNVVTIDGVNPQTAPSVAGYAFFRPLYMYFNDAATADADQKNMIKNYLCGMLGSQGQKIVGDVGYLPLSVAEISAETATLSCPDLADLVFPTFDEGSEQFQFCKDVYQVVVTGSSTVFPVTNAADENNRNIFVNIATGSSGSSVGIATFLAGANSLAASSRALRAKDFEAFGCDGSLIDALGNANGVCQGKQPKSLVIGRDMLSIIVNAASTRTDVTIADLQDIFVAGTSGLTLCGADIQSGTRDFFEEEIGKITSADFTGYANDEDILDCVTSSPDAIAFIPVAYVADKTDLVKILTVESVDPVTTPSTYPLSRPLYIVYDASALAADKQSKDLMCMLLSTVGQSYVSSVGYTALSTIEIANELAVNNLLCP